MKKPNIEYLNQSFIDSNLIKQTKIIKTSKYSVGAITATGTNPKRQFNQDYGAIMTYPNNENLAMYILADGKDDSVNGKVASSELVHTLSEWFLSKKMSESYINIPVILEGNLLGELRKINRKLYNDNSAGDTSFALAIIGKKDTLIANVGNVRCYSINKDDIKLQTTDNLTWYLYNNPELINPDEVKYLAGKDYISRTIGKSDNKDKLFEPFINIIENKSYQSLLLTTHGVNDVLDSVEMLEAIKNNTVSEALYEIIYNSVFTSPKTYPENIASRFKHKENMLIKQTVPGDSNASAILYKKTR